MSTLSHVDPTNLLIGHRPLGLLSGEEGDAAVGDAVWPYIPPSDLPGHTGMHRCVL